MSQKHAIKISALERRVEDLIKRVQELEHKWQYREDWTKIKAQRETLKVKEREIRRAEAYPEV